MHWHTDKQTDTYMYTHNTLTDRHTPGLSPEIKSRAIMLATCKLADHTQSHTYLLDHNTPLIYNISSLNECTRSTKPSLA